MEVGAATPPPDQLEAAVPSPLDEQDAAERESAPRAALAEQAKAVPTVPRTGESELPPATLLARATALSGPLPPPEMLDQYEQILPGAAERLFTMVERREEHRQALEREESEADRALDGEELRLTHRREMNGVVAGAGVVFGVLASESHRQQCLGCVSRPRALAVPGWAALATPRWAEAAES